jgi:hypothetical protein
MSESNKDEPVESRPTTIVLPRPLWLRLMPWIGVALIIAAFLFFSRIVAWLEVDLGFGSLAAILTTGLVFLTLAVVYAAIVFTVEHRRNRL